MSESKHNPGLHAYAILLVLATFPLIFIGGLVTSHGAGMSVPDWPNSYGYNMFLFPPSKWIGNIWYEHIHRLYASGIGLLSIGLCVWAWVGDKRRNVRWLCTAVLGGVIFQGILGGLRVVLVQLDLAIVHACTAQAFFCLTVLVALVTSRWWEQAPNLSHAPGAAAGRWTMRLAIVAVAVVFGQLIVGAVMRHEQAGLAIPDFPLNYGRLLPPTNSAQLRIANAIRGNPCGTPIMPSAPAWYRDWMTHWPGGPLPMPWHVSLAQVWLAFAHRVGALIVSITLLFLIYKVVRLAAGAAMLRGLGMLLGGLLLLQLILGALTVLLRKPADVASAHVAIGALVLATTFALSACAVRLYRRRTGGDSAAGRAFEIVERPEPAVV